MQLVVADEDNKPISNVFPQIFEFIKGCTETAGTDEQIEDIDPAAMTYPNSTCTVVLNYQTHISEIKMDAQELQYSRIQNHYRKVNQSGEDGSQNCVLVHCAMGKSRSATAFIMHVMRRFGMTMDNAFEYCKSQRQLTEPNEGFM